jgi:ABC-type bacteriocin/lantibiotic exporter with double-glycine peptidase domain
MCRCRSRPVSLSRSWAGGALSGGQRRRLLIARALASDPRLLFFDEATSALDNRTQAEVSASLDQLRMTRVVVAHRLSTIRHAVRIVVLERGKIVQLGSFESLLRQGGTFADLVRRQLV